jgi:hypothetical protein
MSILFDHDFGMSTVSILQVLDRMFKDLSFTVSIVALWELGR